VRFLLRPFGIGSPSSNLGACGFVPSHRCSGLLHRHCTLGTPDRFAFVRGTFRRRPVRTVKPWVSASCALEATRATGARTASERSRPGALFEEVEREAPTHGRALPTFAPLMRANSRVATRRVDLLASAARVGAAPAGTASVACCPQVGRQGGGRETDRVRDANVGKLAALAQSVSCRAADPQLRGDARQR